MIIGKEEIKKALDNIKFDKEEYQGYEIDYLIMNYYKIPNDTLLEEVTEPSHEFDDITDVYDYIDEIIEEKGYTSTDLVTYIKKENNNE